MSPFIFTVVLLTAVIHATWNFLTKKVAGNIGVLMFSAVTGALLLLPFALMSGVTMTEMRHALPYILGTGLVHSMYYVMLGKSYEHGEISAVYPIARGASVAGTAIVATIFLDEHITAFGIAGILTISLGAFLIGFRRAGNTHAHSIIFALLTGATIISYSVIDKVGVGMIDPVVYAVGLFGSSALFLIPYIAWKHRPVLADVWKYKKRYCAAIGIGQAGTYLVILFVYQVAQVSYVVAVRELSVVFGALLGFRILRERVTMKKAIGIAAIAVGLMLVKIA